MAGQRTPRHSQAAANGAPTLTPLGHYAGRPPIPISRTVTIIGSRTDARLHLHSSTVSKTHCMIVNTANGAYCRDLASRTKVIVNGRPQRESDLNDGDKIQIGKFEFQFNAGVHVRPGKPMEFDPAPPAALHVEGGEMPLPMDDRVVLIGRRTLCDVPLTEESVSTTHAVIFEMNGKRYIRDLGSRTGTFVNGRRIQQQQELALGDEIKIGDTQMTYAPAAEAAAHELDNLIAPVAGATDLDEHPLDDLAAAVARTDDAGAGEFDVDLEPEPQPLAGDIPLDDVPVARVQREPEPQPQAPEPPPEDATTAAIEQELGLAPQLDARSGWRSRVTEQDEQRKAATPPAAEAPPLKEPEPEPELEPLAPLDVEIPGVPVEAEAESETEERVEVEAQAEAEAEVDAEAQVGAEAQKVPTADRPLPGAVELADLARAEAAAEKDVETAEEEIKPAAAIADTADVNLADEQNIHDEVPPAPLALDEPPIEQLELGEVPPLELAGEPRGAQADAGVDTLELSAELPEEALLPSDSEIGTDEPANATLELTLPEVEEQPAAAAAPEPTAEVAPESIDESDRAAHRRASRRRGKGEPIEINLPEPVAHEEPAPAPAAAEAETVEVIDHTQPTPESAQSLEDAVAELLNEPAAAAEKTDETAELTDTAFGRNVEAFAGESTGPLVEARAEESIEPPPALESVEDEEFEVSLDPLDALRDTPFALEEPAMAGVEGDTAGQELPDVAAETPADETAAAEALTIEALAAETNAETVDETPEESAVATPPPLHQQAPEAVAEAEAPQPVEEHKPEPPVAEPSKRAPKIDLTGWGPNQEHFLGGMPLQLNKPAPPPARGVPMRPAAEAPRPMPPRPPKAQPPPRQRSPFDLTPSEVPTEDTGRTVPPYAGKNPKKGHVTTGFDGLAMPPVRQTDVFSQMATPAAFVNGILGNEDVFGGRTGAVPGQPVARSIGEIAQPVASRGEAESHRPGKDAPVAPPPQQDWDAAAATESPAPEAQAKLARQPAAARGPIPPAIPPNAADAYPAPPRKRKWFGLGGLLILMLVCMGAAVAGIYAFVPARAVVQGSMSFRNFTALNELEQRQLKARQQQLLAEPTLRENAIALLRTGNPDAAPGFLGDGGKFSRLTTGHTWNAGALTLRRDGTSPKLDQERVLAVLTALYQANGDAVEESRRLRGRVDALRDAHASAQQRVTELKASIQRTSAAAEARPDAAEIGALEKEAARLENAWKEAAARAVNVEMELKRTRDGLSASPQPAGTAAVPVVDPQLEQLQRSLTDINAQIAQLQQARSTKADDARRQLDAALEAFEKSVAGATAQPGAGPELTAFLVEAEKLRHSTRELTATLIDRQQKRTEKLNELKARLDEKREARRNELVNKDPDLKKWNEELAIAQRQHSAAVSAGLKNDAEEYAAHVETLKKMIASRQALIGEDTGYADAIAELENHIAETTKAMEADRQAAEAKFEENQKAFAQALPASDQLSPEQSAIATNVTETLAGVTAARRAYTAATGATGEGADEQLQKLRDEATTLAATVTERKKQLAAASEKTQLAAEEQGQMTAIKQLETELAAAREAERAAQSAWHAAVKKVNLAQVRLADAREAGEKHDAAKRELDAANKEVDQTKSSLEAKTAQLRKVVDPLPPDREQVRVVGGRDVRERYSLFAAFGIAALFTVLIFFSVRSDRSAAAAVAAARPISDEEWNARLLPPGDAAAANGNGHSDSHEQPGRHQDDARVSV